MAMTKEARKALMEYRLNNLKGREKENAKVIQKIERQLRNL